MAGLSDSTRLIEGLDYYVNIAAPGSIRSTPMEHVLTGRGLEPRLHAADWRQSVIGDKTHTLIPIVCRDAQSVLAAKQNVNFAMEQGSGFHVSEDNILFYGSSYREPTVGEQITRGASDSAGFFDRALAGITFATVLYVAGGLVVFYWLTK